MLKYFPVVVCAAWLGALFGCTRKPKVVTIDQLSFPVIRILETSEWPRHSVGELTTESKYIGHAQIYVNKEDLSRIPVQELWNVTEPVVIDSNANVLDMKEIENEHGGLWIMLNPQARMPVKFKLLQRRETGIEAARELIASCRFLGSDLDSERTEFRRDRIRRATKGEEIMQIICEVPPNLPKSLINPDGIEVPEQRQ